MMIMIIITNLIGFLFIIIFIRIILYIINKTLISLISLHRPERKMRQNAVITCISYNYVSSSLLDVLS